MWKWIFIILLVMPALELGVILWTGSLIGVWSVLGLIVLTGLVGATLAKQQGTEVIRRANMSMQQSQIPGEAIFDGICILIGGITLLTPGFITDFLGFMLLLPITREPLKNALKALIKRMMENGRVIYFRNM